jgi:hypothetical protein
MIEDRKAKYALVIVHPPSTEKANLEAQSVIGQKWYTFVNDAPELIKQSSIYCKKGEGIWEVPLSNGLKLLFELIQWIEKFKFPFRIMILKKPKWVDWTDFKSE